MQDARNADPAWRHSYAPLLESLARRLAERGFTVRVLNHEGAADAALCESLRRSAGGAEVISEADPRALKGLIGAAGVVVGSRYHACVNALSQGVPCLGTAWSHKYRALFQDFGVAEYLLESSDPTSAHRALDHLLDAREEAVARLQQARPVLEAQVDAMWDRVFSALGAAPVT
jgi:colanic acid/amylovoran biosynthesis protein